METKETKTSTLALLVAEEAKKNVGRYNFLPCEEREAKRLHHNICKKIEEIVKQSGIAVGIIVYLGVGTSAHKKSVFDKGYTKFNEKKVKMIIGWLREFADYNKNPSFYHNDRISHAFSKFYDTYKNRAAMFQKAKKDFVKMPKGEYKSNCFTTARQFYSRFTAPLTPIEGK